MTDSDAAAAGPLAGLKVVELSHILAAPTCGLMLADMGAEVIKVERPPKGDMTRHDTIAEDWIGDQTSSFMTVNRNKRSLVLDLKAEAGRAVLERLLTDSDVLVENYRPGVLERLGFGYEALERHHPRLVYCSITGYGLTGPWAAKGGFGAHETPGHGGGAGTEDVVPVFGNALPVAVAVEEAPRKRTTPSRAKVSMSDSAAT